LGFSPHPPVSVYGTGTVDCPAGAFLGSMGSARWTLPEGSVHPSPLGVSGLPFVAFKPPRRPPYRLGPGHPSPGGAYPSPSPLLSSSPRWCRNINLLPITYAFGPRLRTRLTPGGLPLPGNPWVVGDSVSHAVYRYSCHHNLLEDLQPPSRTTFTGDSNAPLPSMRSRRSAQIRGFGDALEPR